MMRSSASLLALAFAVALGAAPSPARAAQIPSQAQGLDADTAFKVGDVDVVNLLNGALTLTISTGSLAPGPELALGLTLVHNQARWEAGEERTCLQDDEARQYSLPEPDARFEHNAGLNWQVSLGRLEVIEGLPPNDDFFRYLDPSGGEHAFYRELHPDKEEISYGNQTRRAFSKNGSYMRLREASAEETCRVAGCIKIEMADGQVREFNEVGDVWRLHRVSDRAGNHVDVTYNSSDWTITDNHSRQMKVVFDGPADEYQKVTSIEVPRFGSATPATYSFEYLEDVATWRHRYRRPLCDVWGEGGEPSPTVTVDVLRRVVQPDGSFWEMTHYLPTGPEPPGTLSGAVSRLRYPTGGAIGWTYRDYVLRSTRLLEDWTVDGGLDPDAGGWANRHRGVATKTLFDRDGTTLGTWSYAQAESFTQSGGGFIAACYSKTTVTDPEDNVTEHFFSTAQNETHHGWSYGLPFSLCGAAASASEQDASVAAPPFLSQRIYDDLGTLVRSVWVEYASDGFDGGPFQDKNHRLVRRKVVFEDDALGGGLGKAHVEMTFGDFDGLGNHRSVTTTASFGAPMREVVTRFNPNRGTFDFDPHTQTYGSAHTFTMPGVNAAWVLDTYDLQRVIEDGMESRVEHCFDAAGLPVRSRRLAADVPANSADHHRSATDVLIVIERSGGFPTRELSFGGDTQEGLDLTYGTLCNADLPPASAAQYVTDHTWSKGTLESSKAMEFCGQTAVTPILTLVDRTIDARTGLVASARDAAGVTTSFAYDVMGRLVAERPQFDAWTQHTYQLPTTAHPNQALLLTTERCAENSPSTCVSLTLQSHTYDGLGRPTAERLRFPGPGGSVTQERIRTYNALGWLLTESVWGDAESLTEFSEHDPFGRAGVVGLPDGTVTTFDYEGERLVTRGVSIGLQGGAAARYTTETKDQHGRLAAVCEGKTSVGGAGCSATGTVLTRYGYDRNDHLVSVCSDASGTSTCAQTRSFAYDGRGFLVAEKHPEVGPFGNGWTHYRYDSRGNVLNKDIEDSADFSLIYSYDAAARLIAVDQDVGLPKPRPLKLFTYARSNTGVEKRAGKLVQATRYNYRDTVHPLSNEAFNEAHTLIVTDRYRYDGDAGRAAERQTLYNLTNVHYVWETGFNWDQLGNLASIDYPRCLHAQCAGNDSPRTVTFGYEDGYLRSVPGYATSLWYQAGGMLGQVNHANGVASSFALDASGMARPSRARTFGAAPSWDSGVYSYDGAGNITEIGTGATGRSYRYDALNRLVFGDAESGLRQTVTYDDVGNITSIANTGRSVRVTQTAPGTNRLTGLGATYDAAGNLTRVVVDGVEQQLTYDALNATKSLATNSDPDLARVFVYDANDERIGTLQCAPNVCDDSGAVDTWTIRDLGGRVLREYEHRWHGTLWTWKRDYVHRGATPLATVERTADGGQRTLHLHTDHLGSIRQITDQAGAEVAYHSYYPFGEEAMSRGQDEVKVKFTGHERDENGGIDLDYMRARFCSPSISRFLAPDPKVRRSIGVTTRLWNRYAYAANDPINAVDRDGREVSFANSQIEHTVMALAARSPRVRGTLALYSGHNGPNLHFGRGDAGFDSDGKTKARQHFQAQLDPSYVGNWDKLKGDQDLYPATARYLTGAGIVSGTILIDTKETLSTRETQRNILHELGHADLAARDTLQYMQLSAQDREIGPDGQLLPHDERPVEVAADEYADAAIAEIGKLPVR